MNLKWWKTQPSGGSTNLKSILIHQSRLHHTTCPKNEETHFVVSNNWLRILLDTIVLICSKLRAIHWGVDINILKQHILLKNWFSGCFFHRANMPPKPEIEARNNAWDNLFSTYTLKGGGFFQSAYLGVYKGRGSWHKEYKNSHYSFYHLSYC